MTDVMVCTPRSLPENQWIEAADRPVTVNPANAPRIERLVRAIPISSWIACALLWSRQSTGVRLA